MQEDTAPGKSCGRTLCSNRWATRGTLLLQNKLDNSVLFQELWDGILDRKLDSEIRGQVIGVQMQIQSFDSFSGIQLGVLVLIHTDNLSFTLQYTNVIKLIKLQKYVFQHYKVSERNIVSICYLKKNNPKLTWKRKVSSNYEEGGAPVELVSKIKEYYRQFFYRAIYMVGNCIRNSYQQKDYIKVLHAMESMILKALREEDFVLNFSKCLCFLAVT